MKLQPLRTNPFNWLECRPTGKINPLRLLSADRYDAYTSDFNCNCLDFRIANRSAEIYAHTTFARSSTWKIVCKISFLILLSATAGCAVVVFWGPGQGHRAPGQDPARLPRHHQLREGERLHPGWGGRREQGDDYQDGIETNVYQDKTETKGRRQ